MHLTPTGSSWLNLVEHWFAELTNKRTRHGVHTSVQALEKDIRAWIDQWNADPKPFVWTKPAEEVSNASQRTAGESTTLALRVQLPLSGQEPQEVSEALIALLGVIGPAGLEVVAPLLGR
jgi:hypothetical protein